MRGSVYEEKILNLIKEKAKANKKEITKEEAEKILKKANKVDNVDDTNIETKKSDKKKKSSIKSSKIKSTTKKS